MVVTGLLHPRIGSREDIRGQSDRLSLSIKKFSFFDRVFAWNNGRMEKLTGKSVLIFENKNKVQDFEPPDAVFFLMPIKSMKTMFQA